MEESGKYERKNKRKTTKKHQTDERTYHELTTPVADKRIWIYTKNYFTYAETRYQG